jgi:hypothetical protein
VFLKKLIVDFKNNFKKIKKIYYFDAFQHKKYFENQLQPYFQTGIFGSYNEHTEKIDF